MKKNLTFWTIIVLLCVSASLWAQESLSIAGEFANVKLFAKRSEMFQFIEENQFKEVYACSDGVKDDPAILIVPASEEVKLSLYKAIVDEYGNIEPNYDICLGEAEPGQAMYLMVHFVNNQMDVVFEAVNGIGQRAYWSPKQNKDKKLFIDEDFGNTITGH